MDKKKFNTVVMDGSNWSIVMAIRDMIDMIVGNRKTSECHMLDGHVDKFLIETETTDKEYEEAEAVIEGLYPGYCAFNAPM